MSEAKRECQGMVGRLVQTNRPPEEPIYKVSRNVSCVFCGDFEAVGINPISVNVAYEQNDTNLVEIAKDRGCQQPEKLLPPKVSVLG